MGGFRKLRRDQAGFRRFYAYLEETGLEEPLRDFCRAHRTTLYEVFADVKGPTAHAARLECWGWLMLAVGKSAAEIGRLFEREPTSIHYGVARLREVAVANGVAFTVDEVRSLAVTVAARSAEAMARGGKRPRRPRAPLRMPQERVSAPGPMPVAPESETA